VSIVSSRFRWRFLTWLDIVQLKRTQDRLNSALLNIIHLASAPEYRSKFTTLQIVQEISNLVKASMCTPYDYAGLPDDPTEEDIQAITPPTPASLLLPR
jgi:hypothetical protein